MTPTDPNANTTASTDPSVTDQIEQLQEQIARAQQTIRQIQNATGTGVGNTTPARTKSGISIPPVTGVSVTVLGTTLGETRLAVTFQEPAASGTSTIDHYDIYISKGLSQQAKPTLIASTQASPAVTSFQPDAANSTTVFVQTVLTNGQRLPLNQCPTTTLAASAPTINAADLNIGGIHVGPRGVLILNNGTWGIVGSNISWSGFQTAYRGAAHTITAGNANGPYIYWDAASPTVFTGSAGAATGADQFVVAYNVGAGGIYSPAVTIHDSAGRWTSLNALGSFDLNPNGNFTVSLQARTTSAATQGRLAIGDGAGGSGCILDGNGGNASNAGFVATSANDQSLKLFGQSVSNPGPTLQGYTRIQVGAAAYYIALYQ